MQWVILNSPNTLRCLCFAAVICIDQLSSSTFNFYHTHEHHHHHHKRTDYVGVKSKDSRTPHMTRRRKRRESRTHGETRVTDSRWGEAVMRASFEWTELSRGDARTLAAMTTTWRQAVNCSMSSWNTWSLTVERCVVGTNSARVDVEGRRRHHRLQGGNRRRGTTALGHGDSNRRIRQVWTPFAEVSKMSICIAHYAKTPLRNIASQQSYRLQEVRWQFSQLNTRSSPNISRQAQKALA